LRGPRSDTSQRMQEEKQPSSPNPQGRSGKRGPVRDEIGGAAIPDEQEAAG